MKTKPRPTPGTLVDKMDRRALRGMDMSKVVLRPGALDVLKCPSRIGDTLFYPDGRVIK